MKNYFKKLSKILVGLLCYSYLLFLLMATFSLVIALAIGTVSPDERYMIYLIGVGWFILIILCPVAEEIVDFIINNYE